MELRQKTALRKLLAPQLQQSLKILTLSLPDIKAIVEEELQNNPVLEESAPKPSLLSKNRQKQADSDFQINLITQKTSLQEVLLRQLGMFTNTDEEFIIGREIIGNIDENGYLKVSVDEIAGILNIAPQKAADTLKIIQEFEPAGVAARTVSECLLIQLDLSGEKDSLVRKIVEFHTKDVAKKNYRHIARELNEPLENIDASVKKILRLNPKPGRNYSLDEARQIIPDAVINEKDDELEITINNEDIPSVNINKDYRQMLKNNSLDSQTKNFLTDKFQKAQELLQAISMRQATLRKVIEAIAEIQQDAIKGGLSHLTPLTFRQVAERINMHETTVCRVVMNKYIRTPYGVVSLKDFFTSSIRDTNGHAVSSNYAKKLISELIEREDKKHPLSDQEIAVIILKEKGVELARRTVGKYREDAKILSSAFRKER